MAAQPSEIFTSLPDFISSASLLMIVSKLSHHPDISENVV